MKIYILIYSQEDNSFYRYKEFENYDKLLWWLAKHDSSKCLSGKEILKEKESIWRMSAYGISQPFLDNINMNGNDTWTYYEPVFRNGEVFDKKVSGTRQFAFVDEKNKIIDVRNDINKILQYRRKLIDTPRSRPTPGFRDGPIKGTFPEPYDYFTKGHFIPRGYRQNVHIGSLMRELGSDEFKKYGRPSRKVCSWDLCEKRVSRAGSKSWKDKTKKRHQWE